MFVLLLFQVKAMKQGNSELELLIFTTERAPEKSSIVGLGGKSALWFGISFQQVSHGWGCHAVAVELICTTFSVISVDVKIWQEQKLRGGSWTARLKRRKI